MICSAALSCRSGVLSDTVEIAPGESEVLQHMYAIDAKKSWQSAIRYSFEHKTIVKAPKGEAMSKRQAKRDAAARTNRLAAVFSTVNVMEDEPVETLIGGISFCMKSPSKRPARGRLFLDGPAPARPPTHPPVSSARPPRPGEDDGGDAGASGGLRRPTSRSNDSSSSTKSASESGAGGDAPKKRLKRRPVPEPEM
jgi:hypothetical protein